LKMTLNGINHDFTSGNPCCASSLRYSVGDPVQR
jgi:hypothetical protein